MDEPSAPPHRTNRRAFLKTAGLTGVAALGGLPLVRPAAATTAPPNAGAGGGRGHAPEPSSKSGYLFLTGLEPLFIEAAIDILIPADDLGPGALELGVATFIDRQLASAWGGGAHLYLQGPFPEASPQQGYQLALPPAQLIRAGIADTNAWSRRQHDRDFHHLPAATGAEILGALEKDQAELATVPARAFFAQLLSLTREGYFADPLYGGNRGKAAWRMIGFPGVYGAYADSIEPYRNKPYPADPKAIGDFL